MGMGGDVGALNARVASLETEIDHQRGTIAAAELMLLDREQRPGGSESDAAPSAPSTSSRSDPRRPHRER